MRAGCFQVSGASAIVYSRPRDQGISLRPRGWNLTIEEFGSFIPSGHDWGPQLGATRQLGPPPTYKSRLERDHHARGFAMTRTDVMNIV